MFFFSSRRRHTGWPRDWRSDVCSSDLSHACIEARKRRPVPQLPGIRMTDLAEEDRCCARMVGPPRRGDGPGETLSAVFEERAEDTAAGDDEGIAVADFDEIEVEAPRQQRASLAEDDGGRVGDDLVEESLVGEQIGRASCRERG